MPNYKTSEAQRSDAMAYYYANKEAIALKYKNLSDDVRARRLARTRRWRALNRVSKAAYDKNWRKSNPALWRELCRKHDRKPEVKLVRNLRRRLRDFVFQKSSRRLDFGCTPLALRQYLERHFLKGMTWENYGVWHVDHVVPCAYFNLSEKEEQRRCFHFSNLRPLWGVENIARGARAGAVTPPLGI